MVQFSTKTRGRTLQFWALVAFLGLVFLTGGASRIDVLSLALLRPVAAVLCVAALFTLRREHLRGAGWLVGGLLAMAGLVLLHLIPLPPAIWHDLPGRAPLAEVDVFLGNEDYWRPLALVPMNAWHALSSLAVPAAVLLLGLQIRVQERLALLNIVIGFACLSALIGILQLLGGVDGPLYLYNITNKFAAVGLFANRNHSALLLASLLPMLAVMATLAQGAVDRQRTYSLIAVGLGILIVPLLLMNGSRSGLLLGAVGILAALLLYRRPERGIVVRKSGARIAVKPEHLIVGAIVATMLLITIALSRAESIDRLLATSAAEDIRGEFWAISFDLARTFLPWGVGAGSFVEAYQIAEPDYLLHGNYLNRAHNDWLETLVVFGLPGMLLLAILGATIAWRSLIVWKKSPDLNPSRVIARLGAVLIIMTALASVADYPLRTPIFMALSVVFLLWLTVPLDGDAATLSKRSELLMRREEGTKRTPQWFGRAIAFSLVGAVLGWFSFSLAMSGIARQRAPTVALTFTPSEPVALARQAEQLLAAKPKPQLDRIEQLSSVALRNQLVNPRALRLLGAVALARGDEVRATKLLGYSQQFSRRDLYTQFLLVELSINRGDAAAVFRHYDIALRTHPASSNLVFPRMAAALHLPIIQQGIRPYLAAGKGWSFDMLDHAISHHKNLKAVTQLMLAETKMPVTEASRERQVRLLSALATEKMYEDAEMLFRAIPNTQPELLRSVALTPNDARRRFGPVGWLPLERPDAGSDVTSGTTKGSAQMSVYANSSVTAAVAQRLLFLSPGKYRLSARVSKETGGADSGTQWQLRCLTDATQPLLWEGMVGQSLSVPADCKAQRLEIVAVGGADQSGFAGSIRDIALTRQ